MARPFQAGSTLSVHRAFVVHLGPEAAGRRRRFRGRVEHLSSGQAAWFASVRELTLFLSGTLEAMAPPASAGGSPIEPPPCGSATEPVSAEDVSSRRRRARGSR